MNKTILLSILTFLSYTFVNAGNSNEYWSDNQINKESIIKTASHRSLALDYEKIKAHLDQAPWENITNGFSSNFEIEIPLPDGTFETFVIERTKLMEDELSTKYPGIKTFSGYSTLTKTRRITLDYTYQGFHAMIKYPGDAIYIDPYTLNNKNQSICYYRSEFYKTNTETFEEFEVLNPNNIDSELGNDYLLKSQANGNELRTYRLAVATTGQYSNYHGGTKPLVLSAVQTTVARVNQVYENDVAVRLVLIANNDLIIYLNSGSDPYTNSNAGADLNTNQTNIDNVIGFSNYDLGHVMGTGGGGLASLGVPCTNTKAQGVTGSFSPIGDPFDIDYVAHEIGHQFGAEHTFNGTAGSCGNGNRNSGTAYEPGSGTTIMAYAGICGNHNITQNSDDFFHIVSVNQIIAVTHGVGNSCATITNTGNTPPVAGSIADGQVIPIETPFELEGSGTDADGDPLTYIWEQYDRTTNGGHPSTYTDKGPLFRDWTPSTSPDRIIPHLPFLLINSFAYGEKLSTGTRDFRFRLTVRDNKNAGGGIDESSIFFESSTVGGPFLVEHPNTSTDDLEADDNNGISWDVANTTASPISCPEVDIFLSTDGGNTWPTTLASNVPNDGYQVVVIPANLAGETKARIKIKASNNIFFDISDKNFKIIASDGVPNLISEDITSQLTISPNPAIESITIQTTNFENSMNASIYSTTGQFIRSFIIDSNTKTINVSDLSSGIYHINIWNNNINTTEKLIIK